MKYSQSMARFLLFVAVIVGSILSVFSAAATELESRVQEIEGELENDQGIVYTLKDLKQGDTVYAYMKGTSGNLDPFLGVFEKKENTLFSYDEILGLIAHSQTNIIDTFSLFADEKFALWDDDSGNGYDAKLQFSVPYDGDYYVFAGSMFTTQAIDNLEPTFTFGRYSLLVGINSPAVLTGESTSTDESIAIIDSEDIKRPAHVQKVSLKLTGEKHFTYYYLRSFKPGDTLYVRLESVQGMSLPRLFIGDFAGKPLFYGKEAPSGEGSTLSYHFQEGESGLTICIDNSHMTDNEEGGEYQLVAGINAPDVLLGDDVPQGRNVFKSGRDVTIGTTIDQIVNVDQQSENFTVVGSLQMSWQDPDLAFSPDKCNCSGKMMDLNGLKALAAENDVLIPTVTFFNQQGNRWTQSQNVYIEPSGRTTYTERFTVTLQAPDFDFRLYPFDTQKFKLRLELNSPTEIFAFKVVDIPGNSLGDQLGEEEWSVINYSHEITEVPYGKSLTTSRYTTTLEMNRHLNYYIFRILIPLFLIISVSWVIFFLKGYGKQLDVASGNLLVFVAFNFTISNDLPRLGYLTFLDRIIITSFCCAALVVFISVCQKRLEAKGKLALADSIDKAVLIIYPLIYVVLISIEYYSVLAGVGG